MAEIRKSTRGTRNQVKSKPSATRFGRKIPAKPEAAPEPPPKRDILRSKSLVSEIVEDVKNALEDFLRNPENQKWMRSAELCLRLRVTERTLYNWVRQGMPFFNHGYGQRKFYLPDVLSWLAERESQINRIQAERREIRRMTRDFFRMHPKDVSTD